MRELIERSSWRQAAQTIGVSVGALQNFLGGSVPHEKTLTAIENWAVRAGRHGGIQGDPGPPVSGPVWKSLEDIGAILDGIRRRCGVTQERFAEMLKVGGGQADISRAIAGKKRLPYEALETAARLVGADVRIFQADTPPVTAPREPMAEPEDETLRGLWRRVDAIAAREDLTPVQREMLIERELQMHRQSTLAREARIAEVRTRALAGDHAASPAGDPLANSDLLEAVLRALQAFREAVPPPPAEGPRQDGQDPTDGPGLGE